MTVMDLELALTALVVAPQVALALVELLAADVELAQSVAPMECVESAVAPALPELR